MAECPAEKKQGTNSLALTLFIIIIVTAVFAVILSLVYPEFINLLSGGTYVSGGAIYDAIYVVLTMAADALYLFGGGVIAFGAILVTIRFIQCKLKDPFQSSFSTRFLSGYLTLSLNFFIGAEIIRTVAVRTIPEFELLFLVIFSRGLFSLILYLERRWHGTTETE
ncbi:MAG: DUF1622 domain-containing protein [Candidatus Bathyarchaeota archaeon]|jgi:uncharacterized membrane protein|nr:DUF1622 domain-containing protein [Candidatus Bathyarchaeota archaeon]